MPSLLDPYANRTRTLEPFPLSFTILNGRETGDDERLAEAQRLFNLVYPTIPKDFQSAAVRSNCNTKQDFRGFRTVVLTLTTGSTRAVVSCATVRIHESSQILEVLFIATNPTLQRRGYGRLLLHLIQDLVHRGGVRLTLACASSDAVPFWMKLGFRVNNASRVHGWRLVQLGGTKVMSLEVEGGRHVHRLPIAKALLRLKSLTRRRRLPVAENSEMAIPDLKRWLDAAKRAVATGSDVDQKTTLKGRGRGRGVRNGRRGRDVIRVGRGNGRVVTKSSSSSSRGAGNTSRKIRRSTDTRAQEGPPIFNFTHLRRSARRIRRQDFFLPHGVIEGGAAGSAVRVDPHQNTCHLCGRGGRLLCCDGCVYVFHTGCLEKKLDQFPQKEFPWFCSTCSTAQNQTARPAERRTRSNTRQQWNARVCSVCRRRCNPWDFPQGPWDVAQEKRICDACSAFTSDRETPSAGSVVCRDDVDGALRFAVVRVVKDVKRAGGSGGGDHGGDICQLARLHRVAQYRWEENTVHPLHDVPAARCLSIEGAQPLAENSIANAWHIPPQSGPFQDVEDDDATNTAMEDTSINASVPPGTTCALCRRVGDTAGEGALVTVGSGMAAHEFCLRFSPGGRDARYASSEVKRGLRVHCAACSERGATMPCSVRGCNRSYHLRCAARSDCRIDKLAFLSEDGWGFFCPECALDNPAAERAAGAPTLRHWTSLFDPPLGEPNSVEDDDAEEDDAELEVYDDAEEGDAELEVLSSFVARRLSRDEDARVPQTGDRVLARYRASWYPGKLVRTRDRVRQFGVKCDVDKRNSMVLWVARPDIKCEPTETTALRGPTHGNRKRGRPSRNGILPASPESRTKRYRRSCDAKRPATPIKTVNGRTRPKGLKGRAEVARQGLPVSSLSVVVNGSGHVGNGSHSNGSGHVGNGSHSNGSRSNGRPRIAG